MLEEEKKDKEAKGVAKSVSVSSIDLDDILLPQSDPKKDFGRIQFNQFKRTKPSAEA